MSRPYTSYDAMYRKVGEGCCQKGDMGPPGPPGQQGQPGSDARFIGPTGPTGQQGAAGSTPAIGPVNAVQFKANAQGDLGGSSLFTFNQSLTPASLTVDANTIIRAPSSIQIDTTGTTSISTSGAGVIGIYRGGTGYGAAEAGLKVEEEFIRLGHGLTAGATDYAHLKINDEISGTSSRAIFLETRGASGGPITIQTASSPGVQGRSEINIQTSGAGDNINITPSGSQASLMINGQTRSHSIIPQTGKTHILGAGPDMLWNSVYTTEVHAGGGQGQFGNLTLSAKTLLPNSDFGFGGNPCDIGSGQTGFRRLYSREGYFGRQGAIYGAVTCYGSQSIGAATISGLLPSIDMSNTDKSVTLSCASSVLGQPPTPALVFRNTATNQGNYHTIIGYGRDNVTTTVSPLDRVLNMGYDAGLDNNPISGSGGGYQMQFTVGPTGAGTLDIAGKARISHGITGTIELNSWTADQVNQGNGSGPYFKLEDPNGANGPTRLQYQIITNSSSGMSNANGVRLAADVNNGAFEITAKGTDGLIISNGPAGGPANPAGDLTIKSDGATGGNICILVDKGDIEFDKGLNFNILSISEQNRTMARGVVKLGRPLQLWNTSGNDVTTSGHMLESGDIVFDTANNVIKYRDMGAVKAIGPQTYENYTGGTNPISNYPTQGGGAGSTGPASYNNLNYAIVGTSNTTQPAGGPSSWSPPLFLPPYGESAPLTSIKAPIWNAPGETSIYPILSTIVLHCRGRINYQAGYSSNTNNLTYSWSNSAGGGLLSCQLAYEMGGTPSDTPDALSNQGRYFAPRNGWIISASVKFYSSATLRQGGGGGYVPIYNPFMGFYLAPGNTTGTPHPSPRGFPNNLFKPFPVYRYLGFYQVSSPPNQIAQPLQSVTIPGYISWNLPTQDWVYVKKGDPLPYISMTCPLNPGAGAPSGSGASYVPRGTGQLKFTSNNAQSSAEIINGSVIFAFEPLEIGTSRGDKRWDTGLV